MLPCLFLSLQHWFQLFNRLIHLLLSEHVALRLLLLMLYFDLHFMILLIEVCTPRPTLMQLILWLLIQVDILLLFFLRHVAIEDRSVFFQLGLVQHLYCILILLFQDFHQRVFDLQINIGDGILVSEGFRGELLLTYPLLVDWGQVLVVRRYSIVGLAPYFFFISGTFVDPHSYSVLLRR